MSEERRGHEESANVAAMNAEPAGSPVASPAKELASAPRIATPGSHEAAPPLSFAARAVPLAAPMGQPSAATAPILTPALGTPSPFAAPAIPSTPAINTPTPIGTPLGTPAIPRPVPRPEGDVRRTRARMRLRIPDDEVARPSVPPESATTAAAPLTRDPLRPSASMRATQPASSPHESVAPRVESEAALGSVPRMPAPPPPSFASIHSEPTLVTKSPFAVAADSETTLTDKSIEDIVAEAGARKLDEPMSVAEEIPISSEPPRAPSSIEPLVIVEDDPFAPRPASSPRAARSSRGTLGTEPDGEEVNFDDDDEAPPSAEEALELLPDDVVSVETTNKNREAAPLGSKPKLEIPKHSSGKIFTPVPPPPIVAPSAPEMRVADRVSNPGITPLHTPPAHHGPPPPSVAPLFSPPVYTPPAAPAQTHGGALFHTPPAQLAATASSNPYSVPPPVGPPSPLVQTPPASPVSAASAPSGPHQAAPPSQARISEPPHSTLPAHTPREGAAAIDPKHAARVIVPQVGNGTGTTLAPPALTEAAAAAAAARRKTRPWWEELFNDDFIRTMAKITDRQIAAEVDFIEESLGVEKGAMVLDLGCGTGRHAIELTTRGYHVVGFDLSLAMLARAADEAGDRGQQLNFVQGDMREMTFENTFDSVYCWNTSFGFFEEEKNAQVVQRVHRALKSGGTLLLDVANRDYLAQQAPSLAWFEGEGCICMDEMQIDWITSRMRVKRTMMMDDARTREIEYSIRIYSLHELGKILHDSGFRVAEVSGRIATPGVFFGSDSPRTLIVAEKR